MTYFTRTHQQQIGGGFTPTGAPRLFAHDECLPDDQFEIVGSARNPLRTQRPPWCWDVRYGAPEPCHYCGKPVS